MKIVVRNKSSSKIVVNQKMSEIFYNRPLMISAETLNRSTRDVYYLIKRKQQINSNDIRRRTKYGDRTIRSAIRRLIDLRLIRRIPNLQDMRSCFYEAVA
jgi:DNA-binding MarR family transcriptional regulator